MGEVAGREAFEKTTVVLSNQTTGSDLMHNLQPHNEQLFEPNNSTHGAHRNTCEEMRNSLK